MEEGKYTARRSIINSDYYIIYLDGRAHRVCHKDRLEERWPTATIEEDL